MIISAAYLNEVFWWKMHCSNLDALDTVRKVLLILRLYDDELLKVFPIQIFRS